MTDKQDMLRIKRIITKDARLKKLDVSFENLPQYNIPVKNIFEEIERIHMTRKTRHLNRKSASFVQDITEGLIDDQANRSRLTEILMSCIHTMRNLNSTLDSLEGYLLVEYAAQLSSIRTKAERVGFIQYHILVKYKRYIDRVQRVKEAAELVIVDIDKAAWMYRNLIESAKLASGRREEL